VLEPVNHLRKPWKLETLPEKTFGAKVILESYGMYAWLKLGIRAVLAARFG
jgi:hypothetical protein